MAQGTHWAVAVTQASGRGLGTFRAAIGRRFPSGKAVAAESTAEAWEDRSQVLPPLNHFRLLARLLRAAAHVSRCVPGWRWWARVDALRAGWFSSRAHARATIRSKGREVQTPTWTRPCGVAVACRSREAEARGRIPWEDGSLPAQALCARRPRLAWQAISAAGAAHGCDEVIYTPMEPTSE